MSNPLVEQAASLNTSSGYSIIAGVLKLTDNSTLLTCGFDTPSPALHRTQRGASVATSALAYSTTVSSYNL